jgi:8-oxo-dGTP pyrophosphatase MutT (NUDIX family)
VAEEWARRSARVILVDTADRVLLMRSGELWFTPGGGIEAGESVEQAAVRELWEETGLRIGPERLGPVVARTSGYADLGWATGNFSDTYFFVRAPAGFEVDNSGYQDLEQELVDGHRWWTADEVAETPKAVIPLELEPLLRDLLAGRVPAEPVQLPWHH